MQLAIDRGKESEAENRAILDQLKSHKREIEQAFGAPLIWYEREGVRLRRIINEISTGGYRDHQEKWPAIQDTIIESMIRLERALKPFVQLIQ